MNVVRRLKVCLLLLLLVLVSLAAILTTRSGLRILVKTCDILAGPAFTVGRVRGTFFHAWRLDRVEIRLKTFGNISIDTLSCNWNIRGIRHPTLQLSSVRAEGVRIHLISKQTDELDRGPAQLPVVHFPVEFRVEDMQVLRIKMYFSGNKRPVVVDRCVLRAVGTGNRLSIKQLTVDSPKYGATLKADLHLHDRWPLEIHGRWKMIGVQSGDTAGSFTTKGDVESMRISVEVAKPFVADIHGRLTGILHDPHWRITGKIKEFQANDVGLASPLKGKITGFTASGTGTSYSGELTADMHWSGYPDIRCRLQAHGDRRRLQVDSLKMFLPKGGLAAEGWIEWGNGISWQVELQGNDVDPAVVFPQWPGDIYALFSSRGTWSDGKLTAALTIKHLQGSLRGRHFTAGGELYLHDKTVRINGLHLQSGSTLCRVNGRIGKQFACIFGMDSDALSDIVPGSSGSLHVHGALTGTRMHPWLRSTITGTALQRGKYSLRRLRASVNMDFSADGALGLSVQGKDGIFDGKVLNTIRCTVSGTDHKHQIRFLLRGSPGDVDMAADGTISEGVWQGKITKIIVQHSSLGQWSLEKNADLTCGKNFCALSAVHLKRNQAKMVFAGQWQRSSGWQFRGSVRHFALKYLHTLNAVFGELDGTLRASVRAGGTGTHVQRGKLDITIPAMYGHTNNIGDNGRKNWRLLDTSVHAQLADGTADIRAQTKMPGAGNADVTISVEHVNDVMKPETMSLSGTADAHLSRLDFLAPLSGYFLSGSGRLTGHYNISGTLAHPSLSGDMALVDGNIQVPAAGITVQDARVKIVGTGIENNVDLRLVSGGGELRMRGKIGHDPGQGWYGNWSMKGDNVQVVHLPEYEVRASPDLRCVYGQTGLHITGSVIIPRAHIAPVRLQGVVSPSPDVVVIDATGSIKKDTLPISTNLTIIMGKNVELDAFGIKGLLGGSVEVIRKPGEDAIGIGSLQLREATYNLRGSVLKIENGQVFYQGGPLDDPNVDVRADTKVQGKIVGVQLSGRISKMKIDLFSSPSMDESDILAYLLVGHNLSQSDGTEPSLLGTAVSALTMGVGDSVLAALEKKTGLDVSLEKGEIASGYSLVLSKKIYKNLFVSYGKGLTDSESIFKIHYQLPDGFSIETESTSTTDKVEVFWSVER